MRTVSLLLSILLLSAVPSPAQAQGDEVQPVFGDIIILRKSIFNPSVPGYNRFPFNWLNRLHVKTRENVIRRNLLFREGDPFDQELILETERVLRQLTNINYASVVVLEDVGNTRRVIVETHDNWTTRLDLSIPGFADSEKKDEDENLKIALMEDNFLGLGKKVGVRYTERNGKGGFGWEFKDPLLFNTRWLLCGRYINVGENEREWESILWRPFYALNVRWGGGVLASYESDRVDVYQEDRRVAEYRRELFSDYGAIGYMFGDRSRKTLFHVDIRREERRYSGLVLQGEMETDSVFLPSDEELPILGCGLRYGRFRFSREHQIDHFDIVEDIEQGGFGAVAVGKIWDADALWRFYAGGQVLSRVGERAYLSLETGLQSDHYTDDWRRTRLDAISCCYLRWSKWHTLACRTLWEESWKGDVGDISFVDRRNGLRGYSSRDDSGHRRFLLNVENRVFSPIRFLTVAVGGALFIDVGGAWDRDEPVDWREIHSSVGGGLRLGLTKIRGANVFRLDLVRNLRDGYFQLDVALGQVFEIPTPFSDFIGDLNQ